MVCGDIQGRGINKTGVFLYHFKQAGHFVYLFLGPFGISWILNTLNFVSIKPGTSVIAAVVALSSS